MAQTLNSPKSDVQQASAPQRPPPFNRSATEPGLQRYTLQNPLQQYTLQNPLQRYTLGAIQRDAGDSAGNSSSIHRTAGEGLRGSSGSLPHLGTVQRSFGSHDVTTVQAHTGSAAASANKAMGSEAYATGNHVAFKSSSPSLHTTAHEAAHIVQQRAGVSLKGGVGQVGDKYERHADAVADAVVQRRDAEGILDQMAGGSRGMNSGQSAQFEGGGQQNAPHLPSPTQFSHASTVQFDYSNDIHMPNHFIQGAQQRGINVNGLYAYALNRKKQADKGFFDGCEIEFAQQGTASTIKKMSKKKSLSPGGGVKWTPLEWASGTIEDKYEDWNGWRDGIVSVSVNPTILPLISEMEQLGPTPFTAGVEASIKGSGAGSYTPVDQGRILELKGSVKASIAGKLQFGLAFPLLPNCNIGVGPKLSATADLSLTALFLNDVNSWTLDKVDLAGEFSVVFSVTRELKMFTLINRSKDLYNKTLAKKKYEYQLRNYGAIDLMKHMRAHVLNDADDVGATGRKLYRLDTDAIYVRNRGSDGQDLEHVTDFERYKGSHWLVPANLDMTSERYYMKGGKHLIKKTWLQGKFFRTTEAYDGKTIWLRYDKLSGPISSEDPQGNLYSRNLEVQM